MRRHGSEEGAVGTCSGKNLDDSLYEPGPVDTYQRPTPGADILVGGALVLRRYGWRRRGSARDEIVRANLILREIPAIHRRGTFKNERTRYSGPVLIRVNVGVMSESLYRSSMGGGTIKSGNCAGTRAVDTYQRASVSLAKERSFERRDCLCRSDVLPGSGQAHLI